MMLYVNCSSTNKQKPLAIDRSVTELSSRAGALIPGDNFFSLYQFYRVLGPSRVGGPPHWRLPGTNDTWQGDQEPGVGGRRKGFW